MKAPSTRLEDLVSLEGLSLRDLRKPPSTTNFGVSETPLKFNAKLPDDISLL